MDRLILPPLPSLVKRLPIIPIYKGYDLKEVGEYVKSLTPQVNELYQNIPFIEINLAPLDFHPNFVYELVVDVGSGLPFHQDDFSHVITGVIGISTTTEDYTRIKCGDTEIREVPNNHSILLFPSQWVHGVNKSYNKRETINAWWVDAGFTHQ